MELDRLEDEFRARDIIKGKILEKIAIRDLRVEIDGNCVILKGKTSTFYAKQMAQTIAMSIVNVREGIEVCNKIHVIHREKSVAK